MNILELKRISLGHKYREENDHDSSDTKGWGSRDAGGDSSADSSSYSNYGSKTGDLNSGDFAGVDWGAVFGGSVAPAPFDYQTILNQLAADKAAAEQAAREQAAREALLKAEQEAAADQAIREQAASTVQAQLDASAQAQGFSSWDAYQHSNFLANLTEKLKNWGLGGEGRGGNEGGEGGASADMGNGFDFINNMYGALPVAPVAPAALEPATPAAPEPVVPASPETVAPTTIEQTLIDAGLVAPEPNAPAAPVEKTIEQKLVDAGLVSTPQELTPLTVAPPEPVNTVASIDVTNPFDETLDNDGLISALKRPQVLTTKPAGLTDYQINKILDNTDYSDTVKNFIKSIQPAPDSTLGLLGINPGITYDQYRDVVTPEQNNARLQKFGSIVDSAANMLISASPIGPAFNAAKTVGNVISGKQTVGEAITQMGSAVIAGKIGISSSVLTKALNGDLGGAAQSYITGKLSTVISKATGLPTALVSAVIKDADINKGTGDTNSTTNIFSKTIDGILGTGKEPISKDKLKTLSDSVANFTPDQIAALNSNEEELIPEELMPFRVDVTAGNQKESVGSDFDYSKLPPGTDLATQEDRDNGLASYDVASNSWVVNAEKALAPATVSDLPAFITGVGGNNTVTDSALPVNPNVGTVTPSLAPVTASGLPVSITGATGNNLVTDSSLPVDPNVGTTTAYLDPVTVTAKRPSVVSSTGKDAVSTDAPVLEPVYVTAKRPPLVPLKTAPAEPSIAVTPVDVTTSEIVPDKTTTDKTTTDKTTTDKTTTVAPTKSTAADHFYGTITQGQPTTLADIKYFLEMEKADILPPNVEQDILELLINQSSQPKSVEELLHHLRS